MSRHRGPEPRVEGAAADGGQAGYGVSDLARWRGVTRTHPGTLGGCRPAGRNRAQVSLRRSPGVRNLESLVRAERQAGAGSAPCHGASFSRNDRGRYTGKHSGT
jgi:hypothetical protein